MKEKDIDEVSQIEQNTFSTPWSRNSFLEAINNENTLYIVAHKDGEVAGYAGLWQSFDEGEITNVAVNPKYRHQGIGLSLMKWLEQKGHERGINAFLLEVRESNDNARNLYTKIGY